VFTANEHLCEISKNAFGKCCSVQIITFFIVLLVITWKCDTVVVLQNLTFMYTGTRATGLEHMI
jgi:hypothetical protein